MYSRLILRQSAVQRSSRTWRRNVSLISRTRHGGKNRGYDSSIRASWIVAAGGSLGAILVGREIEQNCLQYTRCEAPSQETKIKKIVPIEKDQKPGDSKMGVEFRETPHHIKAISPPLHDFFSKQILLRGGLPVRCHECVSDAALWIAADRLSFMLRYMPESVIERLIRREASFHIIGIGQNTSCLPEHAHMKDVPGGYTGEDYTLDERTRGVGGVNSSCGEENLIDLDADPRYSGKDILVHEFAHCIMDVGLPMSVRDEIKATWKQAVAQGLWEREDGTTAYAGTNEQEYFAELSMWYFGTRGEYVDEKRQIPQPGPGGLREYDKDGFDLVASIYSGSHPELKQEESSHAVAPQRLQPLDRKSNTKDITKTHVSLEFDNRGCNCAWRLYWIPKDGERRPYGTILKSSMKVQFTYPGQVWELERDEATTAADKENSETSPIKDVLQYVASHNSECVAPVAEDSNCKYPRVRTTR